MMRLASIHPQIQALLAGCFLKGVQCTPVTDITHTGHSAKQVPVEENHNIALRIPQSLESLGMSQPKYPKEHISYILNPLKNTGFTRRAEIPNSQQEGQSWIRLIKEEFQALKSETYEFLRLCSCVPSRNKRTPELIGIIDIIALLKDSRNFKIPLGNGFMILSKNLMKIISQDLTNKIWKKKIKISKYPKKVE
ncbi:hypothetical protein PGTUg99_036514 [Puccinia graminis f. sp. tritici]|uniref:Uncharacterized protein n=1 Tax=Puccinia graminis f. sp. tritici TaxID=56615 RepID=A0A5B0LW94_PUCGR|nr:hypothetical protein PGTUg99_036514 [Puccinia graminis f. sp. tritici]